jgi:hypothetical protein
MQSEIKLSVRPPLSLRTNCHFSVNGRQEPFLTPPSDSRAYIPLNGDYNTLCPTTYHLL